MIYEFGDFALDTRRYELRRAGEPQHLEPQVYAVLCHLVEHRDRLVTTQELIEHVWGHRFITPGTLNSRIKALRQALHDDGSSQRVI
ncbi:MAG: winged helix-turn-helix domain-containing protein, partial [Gemmatimonadaceae bacterium]